MNPQVTFVCTNKEKYIKVIHQSVCVCVCLCVRVCVCVYVCVSTVVLPPPPSWITEWNRAAVVVVSAVSRWVFVLEQDNECILAYRMLYHTQTHTHTLTGSISASSMTLSLNLLWRRSGDDGTSCFHLVFFLYLFAVMGGYSLLCSDVINDSSILFWSQQNFWWKLYFMGW